MGGNLSRVNDGRTHVSNATAIPSAYNKSSADRWSALPESRAPRPSCAIYPPSYSNVPDYKVPRPFETAVSTADNINRVTAFHSAARWQEYFEASKHSNKLMVIYFTAAWCGPCKYMEPTIKELSANYRDVEIAKIDVDELFNVSREFGVQTMPTFMFIRRGKQIDKVVGANKDDLQRKIEKHRV
ncbi:thioredoxin H2-like [Silene latifolia]|uniref:thioredoxin H2-like n=1 Tax=Silene latifolia TaxID=37657 RepID=UPI003D76BE91